MGEAPVAGGELLGIRRVTFASPHPESGWGGQGGSSLPARLSADPRCSLGSDPEGYEVSGGHPIPEKAVDAVDATEISPNLQENASHAICNTAQNPPSPETPPTYHPHLMQRAPPRSWMKVILTTLLVLIIAWRPQRGDNNTTERRTEKPNLDGVSDQSNKDIHAATLTWMYAYREKKTGGLNLEHVAGRAKMDLAITVNPTRNTYKPARKPLCWTNPTVFSPL